MWKQSIICLLIFCGCSGFEKSEQANIRRANAKAEKILRYHDEHLCKIEKLLYLYGRTAKVNLT